MTPIALPIDHQSKDIAIVEISLKVAVKISFSKLKLTSSRDSSFFLSLLDST